MDSRNKVKPIKERIREAYQALPPCATGRGLARCYATLMWRVFPEEDYPKAYRYSSNGGPPGCAMAFGRALREMGARMDGGGRTTRTVWLPEIAE